MFTHHSVVVVFLVVILNSIVFPRDVTGQPPAPSSSSSSPSSSSASISSDSTGEAVNGPRKEYVCPTFDIRNRLSNFKKLNDCTVVEGNVRIILIEHAEEDEFRRLAFPKLREITGYLLLYRVYGLRSLTDLFPNLVVIRGQVLFFNYALVIFEMPGLEEIGLHSLTRIVRGGLRMEKNAQLCYVDTVDWQRVTSVKMADNFILQNKVLDECVNVCPKNRSDGTALCPIMDVTLSKGEKTRQELCWNADKCQKVCPSQCGSNNACYRTNVTTGVWEMRCCHAQCIGGCNGPTDEDCIACTNVFHNGRCLSKCPAGTFEYRSRRCLLESDCRSQFSPSSSSSAASSQKGSYWKLYDGKCIEECPTGYTESKTDRSLCERCQGHCPKVCAGQVIDNIAAAQRLKGCTIVDGVLEIQIRGGSSLGVELEENLGMIEEITHFLKIVRSYALVSLRFLRSLRTIHGQKLHNDRYSVFVLDNQNLQDLWDFQTHPNLTLRNGSLFFHFNRKLCLSKINELVDFVGKRDQIDSMDISPTSNGDQVACSIESMTLQAMNVASTFAIIRWTNFQVNDPRSLLSWVINYRKTNQENITIYSARDACGTDVWKAIDVKPDSDATAPFIASILFNLEPFTKYAVYVQTYSIATAKVGAMSKIIYLTTNPDTPSPVRDITVDSKYPGELHVSWKEPSSPNGNVTHYYVYWQPQTLAVEKFHQRDYCKDKLRLPGKTKETTIIPSDKNLTNDGTCCACPKTKQEIEVEDDERRYQIEFENFLHNNIYRKSITVSNSGIPSNLVRKKRSTSSEKKTRSSRKKRFLLNESDIESFAHKHESYKSLLHNNSELPNNTTPGSGGGGGGFDKGLDSAPVDGSEAAIVYGKTEIILTNLRHFQEYNIEVIACHDYNNGVNEKQCSNRAIISGRTVANASADSVDQRNTTVTNITGESGSTGVVFAWKEPISPNGLVVLYEIELLKLDVTNYKADILCIPHQQYREAKGKYEEHDIKPGMWTFRLRAVSLSGPGPWTEAQEFYVAPIETSPALLSLSLIVGVAVAMFTSIIVVSVIVAFVVKKKMNRGMTERDLQIVTYNPNYTIPEKEYVPDEWEVEREKIKIIRELGQGSFGMVYEGIAKDLMEGEPLVRVAIKTVNESASIHDRYSFLNEASIMKAFSSFHVVKLLGVVSQGQPVLVVMELMSNGDLKTFLRVRRPEEENDLDAPMLSELLKWAGEIADGMAYLAYIKYVHRDLAARNCMVSSDLVVKIGDFGMTRDVYATDYYRKGTKGLLPVRWMAPESLRDGVFSSRSDVWSYGVVVWEMATLAAQPYQGLSNEQVLHYVIDGSIMERPEGCPDRLYKLMLECWRMNPKDRPAFSDIIEDLTPDLPESFRENSFYYTMASDDSDSEDDFTSAGSIADSAKDVVGCDDIDIDDSDLIHSKTPLHPAKSSERDPPPAEPPADDPNMITNSRGFLMPVRLSVSSPSGVLPSPQSGRHSASGSRSGLDDKTSISDLDLRDGVLKRGTPTKQQQALLPPYKVTSDAPDRSPAKHRSFVGSHYDHRHHGGDSQPDVVRAGLLGSQDGTNKGGSNHSHKNGLVNGLVPPPYTYRTSPTC